MAGVAAAVAASPAAGEQQEQHKCVFCGQHFPSKPELQTHFRLHANGEIDIKGQPKVRHKVDLRPTKATDTNNTGKSLNAATTTATTTITTTATTTTAAAAAAAAAAVAATTAITSAATTAKNNAMCDVCGEVFRTVSLAISHKFRKHPESVLKHYCPHCGMMFPIKLNRDKHLLTHNAAAPKQLFPCRPCGVTFYNQRAKKFHMDSAHKGAIRMVNPVRTPAPSMKIVVNNAGEAHSVYYCHLCGCEYQVKYNLQKHLATKHTESEREALPKELVQCNLCSAVFYTKRAYEAHSHHHREGDLFATNEQMRQQVVQRIDQDFDHRRVPTAVERYLSASAVSSNRSATWRNIQAARRARTLHSFTQTHSKEEEGKKEDKQEDNEEDSSPPSSKSARLEKSNEKDDMEFSTLNTEDKDTDMDLSGLSVTKGEDKGPEEEGFTQGNFLPWGTDDRPPRKKRMMDDSEEDDGEMRGLGNVNPDSVLSRGLLSRVSRRGVESEEEEEEHRKAATEEGKRKQTYEGESDMLVVECVLGVRKREGRRGREFLVRWRGTEPRDDTWEVEADLVNCEELLQEYLKDKAQSAKCQGTKDTEECGEKDAEKTTMTSE